MSRESNDGHVCPACDTVIYREECACTQPEPLDLQGWLEVAYARLMLNSTSNLIGHLQQSSPLVARHKLGVSFDELEAK